jgi:hypothetical protein
MCRRLRQHEGKTVCVCVLGGGGQCMPWFMLKVWCVCQQAATVQNSRLVHSSAGAVSHHNPKCTHCVDYTWQ